MGLKKKKNIILLTLCMVSTFILYQLYIFLTITSETENLLRENRVVSVHVGDSVMEVMHIRSEADKYINENGIIRGVAKHNMLKYRPNGNNEFKCLNSEQYILYERVNDDYCDCEDGTDEPSTTACVTGVFNCDLQQKKPITLHSVPSSRVNDGICDCCDGSDEWLHKPNQKVLTQMSDKIYRHFSISCPNVC